MNQSIAVILQTFLSCLEDRRELAEFHDDLEQGLTCSPDDETMTQWFGESGMHSPIPEGNKTATINNYHLIMFRIRAPFVTLTTKE